MGIVKVGVSVILIRNDNEILIGKRKGSHGAGLYSVPGGHLEYGETFEECCSRELSEEIGVNLSDFEKVGFSEDYFGLNNSKQYTTLYFKKHVDSNIKIKNLEPEKCEEWIWVNKDKLPKLFCDTNNQINNIK
jgi:8-oxo-dGTP diphosphatase